MTSGGRWEWRTFGAGSPFSSVPVDRVEVSDETYLLSPCSDASVKLRGGLMDVKQLQRVDEHGLQQWLPTMKADMPLSASDARFVLAALGVAAPLLDGDGYTLDELVAAAAGVLAIPVHKRRERYSIDGCMAELCELRTAAGATRTIAVESEDRARVIAVVRELGLSGRENTCMARGLKALAQRFAVIDVGTNSVKFHVGERGADGAWRTVVDRAEVTRLGEGLERSGRLGAAPIERTARAVADMADEAGRAGAGAIVAVGTAGLRIAPNAGELLAAVKARCGIAVEVISAAEEARLAYLAATAGLPLAAGSLIVFDTGGGSSQFTFGSDDRVAERFSVNVGAVRLTERFGLDGPVSEATLAAALAATAAELARLERRAAPDAIIGMGGAVTNLAAVKHGLATYSPDVVQGTVLDLAEIDRQIERYRTCTAGERREIVGLQRNRAEVILAGACIVRAVLVLLGRDWLTVSDRGLRHGLLVDRFS